MSAKFSAWLLKAFKWIAIGFVAVFGLTAIYFWLNYTDVTITEGQGYGFTIGQSKQEAFLAAESYYQGKKIFILSPIDKQGFGPHKKLDFSEDDFQLIQNRDRWEFYFDMEDYFNVLRISFDNTDKLISIYRHKQAFELP